MNIRITERKPPYFFRIYLVYIKLLGIMIVCYVNGVSSNIINFLTEIQQNGNLINFWLQIPYSFSLLIFI